MARYRRRYRTIVRAPKKRWATNIFNFDNTSNGTSTMQSASFKLVENAAQAATPTPVIVKTGNFKVQGDAFLNISAADSKVRISLYIMYVPEGLVVNAPDQVKGLLSAHPEWIMAWKFVSANVTNSPQDNETFTFTTRLKRNLNSGDAIYLLGLAEGNNITSVHFSGVAQYWTCAN